MHGGRQIVGCGVGAAACCGVGAGVGGVGVCGGGVGAGVGAGVGGRVIEPHTSHVVLLTVFVSRVTAPVLAKRRPLIVAPVLAVTLTNARMLPTNVEVIPSVAEEPKRQKTLQSRPPLMTVTDEDVAVVRVLPILNRNTALGLPCASKMSGPVI